MADADRQAGAALVSAIAISMIFAVVGVAAVQLVVNTAFNENRIMEASRHQFALEDAVASAVFQLARSRQGLDNHATLTADTAAGRYTVTVFDPRGLVDINTASPTLLELVAVAAGADAPDQLARDIMQRRQEADTHHAFEHEDNVYSLPSAAGLTADCLRLLVTVSTFQQSPQPDFAPRPLANALGAGPARGRIDLTPGRLIGFDIEAEADPQAPRFRVLLRGSGDPRNPLFVQGFDAIPAQGDCPGYGV